MELNGYVPQFDLLTRPDLLRKIDELREKNVGSHVPLPQIVVVGDQSSGKSSLLQSLNGIPFACDLELCTRYATQITSRRDSSSRVEVTIVPGPHASEEHRKRLEQYHPILQTTKELRAKFPQILAEVNEQMGIRVDPSARYGKIFSEDILKIEICGPNEDYLTVIDVPGIFRSPTEGITTVEDITLVRNMVKNYMKGARTVILAVLPANVDLATQEILLFAEEYDKSGQRTLGVLTKPDLVKERNAQEVVCDVVLGKKRKLALGYHVVRNRGADEGDGFDNNFAEQMFRVDPWQSLPENCVGIQALKTRLGHLLNEITRREFPELRRDIQRQLGLCRQELKEMGLARHTEQAQRQYLSGIARRFENFVHAALHAQYSDHDAFDDDGNLRLITAIVNLTDNFNNEFEQKAHRREFEGRPLVRTNTENDENEVGTEDHQTDVDDETLPTAIDVERPSLLDDIISKEYALEDPLGGIMDWVEQLYLRSRSVDLGTFGGNILSMAFRDQSGKWPAAAKAYVSNAICIVHRFLFRSLNILCPDEHVREEIWSDVQDEVLQKYKLAMEQVVFLVGIERNQRPYTLNHYFNDNLQHARNERNVENLRGKSRKETMYNSKGVPYTTENLVVDLKSVEQATTYKRNLEHTKEDIHDILMSYYKVARKRLIDNIYLQVVDHHLLTGSASPLFAFNQEWVLQVSAARLESIAGESLGSQERRKSLLKKVDELEIALQILKR